jgi:hypothetical protein
MAVRRERMLPFPPSLVCAEENAVLGELATQLAKMHYDPELFVYHERRDSYVGFTRQMHKYGRGRGQVLRRRFRSCRPVHLTAAIVPLWLLSLPIVSVVVSPWYLLSAGIYFLGALAAGLAIALKMRTMPLRRRAMTCPLGAALTMTLHLAYGTGILRGFLRRPADPVSEWRPVPEATSESRLATDDRA